MEKVITIASHVNNQIHNFRASGKPQWSMPRTLQVANRYAMAWQQNTSLLAHMESTCKKAQEIPNKEELRKPF